MMTYQMSPTIASLAASLAKAQGELSAASMNADNPFFKSKYADLGSVWDACRGALSANGLAVIQNPSVSEDGNCVSLTTILAHSSGEWISSTVSSYVGSNQKLSHAQAIGSIITYLRRYALAAMVGVYTGDDNDGNSPEAATKKRQPYAEQPVTTPPANGKPAPGATPGIRGDELKDTPPDPPVTVDADKVAMWREKVSKNSRPTVGTVCSAIGYTGLYTNEQHAINTANSWRDGLWIEDTNPSKTNAVPLHKDDALELFDWLVARKQVAKQPALITTPPAELSYE